VLGSFPEEDPLALKFLGMHGTAYANWAVNGDPKNGIPGADLLLAFGVRFDDRVTGKVEKFCEKGTIVHIDIDASEINKNKPAHLPVIGDIKDALHRLNQMIGARQSRKNLRVAQADRGMEAKAPAPLQDQPGSAQITARERFHGRAMRARSSCRNKRSSCFAS
jgi:acetolactate synthase-1/2/3 large subunit